MLIYQEEKWNKVYTYDIFSCRALGEDIARNIDFHFKTQSYFEKGKGIEIGKYYNKLEKLVTSDLPPIDSLTGIEHCKDLKMVHITNASNLEDLSPLKEIPNLQNLVLDGIPKTVNLSVLQEFPSLSKLVIKNSLIDNLDFLIDCKYLQYLVLDNCDVSDLTSLKYVEHLLGLSLFNMKIKVLPTLNNLLFFRTGGQVFADEELQKQLDEIRYVDPYNLLKYTRLNTVADFKQLSKISIDYFENLKECFYPLKQILDNKDIHLNFRELSRDRLKQSTGEDYTIDYSRCKISKRFITSELKQHYPIQAIQELDNVYGLEIFPSLMSYSHNEDDVMYKI